MYTFESMVSERRAFYGLKGLVKLHLKHLQDPFAPDFKACVCLRDCMPYFYQKDFLDLVEVCYDAGLGMEVLLDLVNEVILPEGATPEAEGEPEAVLEAAL